MTLFAGLAAAMYARAAAAVGLAGERVVLVFGGDEQEAPKRASPQATTPASSWCNRFIVIPVFRGTLPALVACANALLDDERLETLEVGPDDRLDSGGDLLNPQLPV